MAFKWHFSPLALGKPSARCWQQSRGDLSLGAHPAFPQECQSGIGIKQSSVLLFRRHSQLGACRVKPGVQGCASALGTGSFQLHFLEFPSAPALGVWAVQGAAPKLCAHIFPSSQVPEVWLDCFRYMTWFLSAWFLQGRTRLCRNCLLWVAEWAPKCSFVSCERV